MTSEPTAPIPGEIVRYYEQVPEEGRLAVGPGRLECVRTQEILARHLPPAPATVLDVGGAAGVYALWLADAGYRVHLVDASPRLVEEARRRSDAAVHRLAACLVGD
ncbi:MAG TPA: class I SAM-dependent methyltransferase, partial [Candidatus Polarisedimenticolia bacterium]|nr:class I SAM-dependent methyltransferase [Candidatus Polarisedimenticolia bacterium]